MISVLMTTYNCASFIKQAIKSILNQTFTDFELLVVDDGSDDNTSEIVSSFVDKRILYKKVNHLGRSKVLNYGLSIAKHDLISIMDADDIAHPLRLEKQILKLTGNENDICFTDAAFFKGNRILYTITTDLESKSVNETLALHGHFINSTFLFNKNHILKFDGYDESLQVFEDYDLWLRIKNKSNFIIVKEVLQFQRLREQSLTRTNLNRLNKNIFELQKQYYRDLTTSFNIKDKYIQSNLKGWREFFYGDKKLCRKYWLQIRFSNWEYRMIVVYMLTFLPTWIVDRVKKSRIRLRLNYLLQKSTKYKILNSEFQNILNELC